MDDVFLLAHAFSETGQNKRIPFEVRANNVGNSHDSFFWKERGVVGFN